MTLEGTDPLLAGLAHVATVTGWTIRLLRQRTNASVPSTVADGPEQTSEPDEASGWVRDLYGLARRLPPGTCVEHVGPDGSVIRFTLPSNGC